MLLKRPLFRSGAVALAVTLPLLLIQTYSVYEAYHSSTLQAEAQLTEHAETKAAELGDMLARAEGLVSSLASGVRAARDLRLVCEGPLAHTQPLETIYANLSIVGPTGELLCATPPARPGLGYADADWFQASIAGTGIQFTAPLRAQPSNRQIAALSTAIRDGNGALLGVLAVALDLVKTSDSLGTRGVAAGDSLAVFSAKRLLVLRFPQAQEWVGSPVPPGAVSSSTEAMGRPFQARGSDGIEKLFATVLLPRYGLTLAVGTPTRIVYAQAHSVAIRSASLILIALVLTILATIYGAQWLSKPLKELLEAIQQRLTRKDARPLSTNQPVGFQEIAIEFNRLTTSHDNIERDLSQAEQRASRSADFYTALSNTNQAIVRRVDPQRIFEDLCKTCVSSKHASMAWVGWVDKGVVTPIAWGGSAREYTHGLATITVDRTEGATRGPVARAVVSATVYVANDPLADPSTEPWRPRAEQFGVKSCAIFPFQCQDRVVGVLALYADKPNYFDRELVRLLSELTDDISFALDNEVLETRRRDAEMVRERNEKLLTDLIGNTNDAIVGTDQQDRVQVFNHAAELLFLVPATTAIGQPIQDLLPDWTADAAQQTLLGAPTQLAGVRPGGEEFFAEASISRFGEGEEARCTAVLRDVSKVRAAEQSRQARLKAEAANQAKTQFIARMSHELRTPLNAVLGFSQLLQSTAQSKLTTSERRQLDLIFLAGAQLRALIDDVLDTTRIEEGTLSVQLQNADLGELLDSALLTSSVLAQPSRIELKRAFADQAPVSLRTDPVRLRQALLNLISNAIKYSPAGSVVTLDYELRAGHVDIFVADKGMGMSPAQLAKIFQPYNRLGREKTGIEGTGLGMGICRQLVELLGGSLNIESETGKGTQICLTLPLVQTEEELSTSELGALEPLQAPFKLPTRDDPSVHGTVLYLEDDPTNALLVRQLLSRWPNLTLVVCEDGPEGIAEANRLLPDLILLDMNLPSMDGCQVLGVLKGNLATKDIPVVVLSASAMDVDVAAALIAGAADYWTKPIDFQTFLDGLRQRLALAEIPPAEDEEAAETQY